MSDTKANSASSAPVQHSVQPVREQTRHLAIATRLDAAIDRALDEQRIVGTVVLVAHRGERAYARAAGFADREAHVAMREDSLFRLASVTKPIVSLAAMRLVEEGKLALDEAVTKWLPDFTPHLLSDGRSTAPRITIHQLLTHTAGLRYGFHEPPDSPYHQFGISDGIDHVPFDLDENLRRIAKAPLVYAPGTSWRYSVALDVLGAVLERVTHMTLPQAVEALVTGPLGMRQTTFHVPPGTPLVVPYANSSPAPVKMHDGMDVFLPPEAGYAVRFSPSRAFDAHAFPSGGGGMIGTAPELLQFFETIRTGGAPVVSPETVALMMKNHVPPPIETRGPGLGFGYGWGVIHDAALAQTPQPAGTIQWGGVYGHMWFVDPVNEFTVVAFTNTAFEGMRGQFSTDVRDAIYGAAPIR